MKTKIRKNRYLSGVTAILMLLSFFGLFPAMETTAEEASVLSIEIETIEQEKAQIINNNNMVTIEISIPDNPGYTSIAFGIAWYTEELSFLGAQGCTATPSNDTSSGYSFLWLSSMSISTVTDETFATITFEVTADIEVGDYLILQGEQETLLGDVANYVYKDENDALQTGDIVISSGGISIVENVMPQVTVQIEENYEIELGVLAATNFIAEIPVTLEKNNGFSYLQFGISWNPDEISLASDTIADLPDKLQIVSFDVSDAKGTAWVSIKTTDPNYTYSGTELFTLQFQLPETTSNYADGSSYAINLESANASGTQSASVYNRVYTPGTLTLRSGSIKPKTTQSRNVSITCPNNSVSLEALAENEYQVDYPIYISKNSLCKQVNFGLSVQDDVTIQKCVCSSSQLVMTCIPNDNASALSLMFNYRESGGSYVDVALCTVTLTLPSDAQIGDVFYITAQNVDFYGLPAELKTAYSGSLDCGLNLTSGSITITDANGNSSGTNLENCDIAVKISNTIVTTEELSYYDGMITVPITAESNVGFTELSFGISWDNNQIDEFLYAVSSAPDVYYIETYEIDDGLLWITFRLNAEREDTYTKKDLGSITFYISDTVQPGETVSFTALSASPDGDTAGAIGDSFQSLTLGIESGSVQIYSDGSETTTTPIVTTDSTESTATPESTVSSAVTTTTTTTTTTSTTTSTTVSTTTTTTTTSNIPTTTTTTEFELSEDIVITIPVDHTQTVLFTPNDNFDGTFVWTVLNKQVATVDAEVNATSAQVTAVSVGETTLWVMFSDGTKYIYTISVVEDEPTTPTTPETTSRGDVDGDNKITLNDAFLALIAYANHAVGKDYGLTEEEFSAADINDDGEISLNDAFVILCYYANLAVGKEVTWEELLEA